MFAVVCYKFTILILGYTIEAPGYFTKKAMADTVTNGRNGLGSIYVWAAGNGLSGIGLHLSLFSFSSSLFITENDNCNYDGYAASRYTIGFLLWFFRFSIFLFFDFLAFFAFLAISFFLLF